MPQGLKVAVIDFQAGNLTSCHKAFDRVAGGLGHAGAVEIVDRAEQLESATHIVLPGQGAFGDCAAQLKKIPGMVETLERLVRVGGRPFFGICVGMQLLADRGLEFGEHEGLGWIPGQVVALEPGLDPATGNRFKIPHTGWNDLCLTPQGKEHPLLKNTGSADTDFGDTEFGDHAYFVHSFQFSPGSCETGSNRAGNKDILATCDYGGPVTAIIGRDNLFGTQFHPEKSQRFGLKLIGNFLGWKP